MLGEGSSAHIPDPHEKTTVFYGWYSNRTRGYRKQHGLLAKGEAADPLPGLADRAAVPKTSVQVYILSCNGFESRILGGFSGLR